MIFFKNYKRQIIRGMVEHILIPGLFKREASWSIEHVPGYLHRYLKKTKFKKGKEKQYFKIYMEAPPKKRPSKTI